MTRMLRSIWWWNQKTLVTRRDICVKLISDTLQAIAARFPMTCHVDSAWDPERVQTKGWCDRLISS